jgi:hypothetical protein
MKPRIILIHPPVSKPSEPPAGLAVLAGCLRTNGINYQAIDANLEGILYLTKNFQQVNNVHDNWTRRAGKNLINNLAALKDYRLYKNQSRYRRAVNDIDHLFNLAGKPYGIDLTLADYRDQKLTPVRSIDLSTAADSPQRNPFYPYFSERLSNTLDLEPEFIGFSLNYLGQALTTFAMIGFIKQKNPCQKIILGGSLATSWAKLTGCHNIFGKLIDEIIAGAGEKRLLELLGVADNQVKYPPYYEDFPLDQYFSPARILPYSTARGCYWHSCSFCPEKAEDNPYQPQSASQVSTQLQSLCRELKPGLIHFLDSAISPAILNTFTQNHPGAPWYGFARVMPNLADKNFCEALRKSGCLMLKLGIESGDQAVLDQLNKGIDLVTVSRALRALKEAGIATYVYLLFGTPPEAETSARKTLDFVIEHQDCIDFLNLAILNLPVLSEDTQSLATQDFYEGDLSLYRNFTHPLGWQRADVRKFLERTFKKHPAVSAILQRTPEFFTSNHAPFFVLNKSF